MVKWNVKEAKGWFYGSVINQCDREGRNYLVKYDRQDTNNLFVDGVVPTVFSFQGEDAYGVSWILLVSESGTGEDDAGAEFSSAAATGFSRSGSPAPGTRTSTAMGSRVNTVPDSAAVNDADFSIHISPSYRSFQSYTPVGSPSPKARSGSGNFDGGNGFGGDSVKMGRSSLPQTPYSPMPASTSITSPLAHTTPFLKSKTMSALMEHDNGFDTQEWDNQGPTQAWDENYGGMGTGTMRGTSGRKRYPEGILGPDVKINSITGVVSRVGTAANADVDELSETSIDTSVPVASNFTTGLLRSPIKRHAKVHVSGVTPIATNPRSRVTTPYLDTEENMKYRAAHSAYLVGVPQAVTLPFVHNTEVNF